jgi:hypothetical protein
LLCDADPKEKYGSEGAEAQSCERATNGNCRLVWNTMYDPPANTSFKQNCPSTEGRPRRVAVRTRMRENLL